MIAIAGTDSEIESCYAVMAELRPHIGRDEFLPLVRNLSEKTGFRLVYLTDEGEVKAVGGFRIAEWLAGGKYLEIEDLVAASGARSKGYGGALFDWLVAESSKAGCRQLRLLSGVKRTDAHRFYLRKGMNQEAHYFSIDVARTAA
jgi:GNAT superfamily N-acetyltransferase